MTGVKQTVITTTTQQTKTEIITENIPNTELPIMSSALGDRGNVTSPLGDKSKDLPDTSKATKDIEHSVPRSIPDPDESQSQLEEPSNGGDEGELVPAAGRINEKGEVIDDDGQAIGKVTSGEASKFIGYIVTQEGDVLDDDGGVVGKAEPLEDVASELGNYTTKSAKDGADNATEGGKSGLGGVLGGAGNAVSGLTGSVGKTAKGLTGTVGDTTKGATDTVGDATGQKGLTDSAGNAVKGATDTVGETGEGATEAVGETTEGT